ncbi:MAG: alcohol dehydrogenase catalytic domain-containing protein [Candidatus Eremiobacteraeota bacterium]|nr:alcohol dehydrogenase catalytic domain-containing protein [Candidatus Eremiobacteraeota bacterium]
MNSISMVLKSPGKIIPEKRPLPEPGPNYTRVKVVWAGICSTDLAIYNGHYKVPLPLVMGHEFSGIVEAVGPGVSPNWIGKPVVGEINNTCFATGDPEPCIACMKGLSHHCLRRTVIGIDRYDGAFAEHILIPHGNLHRIQEGVTLKEATFTEPLAAAFQAFVGFHLRADDLVVVLGAGKLGLLVIAVARDKGAGVIAIDPDENQRSLAIEFGAEKTFSPDESPGDKIKKLNKGIGADVVVESSGTPTGINTALNIVRPGGIIVQKSTPGQVSEGVDITKIAVNEIRIQGSRCGPFKEALAMLDRHIIPLEKMIRGEYPLVRLQEALETAKKGGKILIRVSDD